MEIAKCWWFQLEKDRRLYLMKGDNRLYGMKGETMCLVGPILRARAHIDGLKKYIVVRFSFVNCEVLYGSNSELY